MSESKRVFTTNQIANIVARLRDSDIKSTDERYRKSRFNEAADVIESLESLLRVANKDKRALREFVDFVLNSPTDIEGWFSFPKKDFSDRAKEFLGNSANQSA